jgi:tape measure domain-containing protein
VAQLNRLNGVAGTTAGTFSRLQSAAAGLGLGLIAKSAVQSAASFKALQTRLKLVTSEFGEYEQAQALVAKAAQQFGISNREAAEGVADIFTRLRPLGISLADIESTFIGFNTVAKLSGVSAAGASAAFTQLAQALGSGRLQGDEFRSIAEQVPGLLQAISSATGIATGDLKEYASQGKLTSDVVIEALKKLESEGADKIAAIVQESDIQRFKDFENATDDLSIAIGTSLLPVVTPLVDGATELVKAFGELPEPIQAGVIGVTGLAGAVAILTPAIVTLNGLITTLAGGTVLKAAITSLSVVGERALAAAAGKTVLASTVTAANTKITAMTVSVGLLNLALKALPFVIVAGAVATFVGQMNEAKKIQDDVNKLVKTGTKDQLEAALATHERTLAEIEYYDTVRALLPGALGGAARGGHAALEKITKRTETVRNAIKQLTTALAEIETKKPDEDKPTPTVIDEDEEKRLALIAAASADRVRSLGQQTLLASALNDEERRQFERQIEIANLLENKDGLNKEQLQDQLEALTNLYEQEDATRAIIAANELRKKKEKETNDAAEAALEAQQREAQRLQQLFGGIGQSISTGIVDSLTKAQNAAEALGNTLRDVANQLLQLGVNTALKAAFPGSSLFSGLLGFADGGRPPVGRPSIVGERGPELFVPDRAGTIVPNHMMGGANVTVNVDASGSSVEGSADEAAQLGKAIGIAVQAELVKQKRPGGLLAN